MHRTVLSVRRRVLGEEHPETLSSNNLAKALNKAGQHTDAVRCIARCCRRRVACWRGASAYAHIDEQPGLMRSTTRVSMQRRLRCIARCCR